MANSYLLPIQTATVVFPLVALLLVVPVAIVLYRHHGVVRWRALSFYGFLYYLLTAACLVIMPMPKASVDVCRKYASMGRPQLIPGQTFSDILKEAHQPTFDALVLHNPAVLKTGFNLLLLLPLGIFLRYHFRRGLAVTAAAGAGISLFFELTQGTGVWGIYPCPYRLFDVDDLVVNTAGAMIGWAVAWPLARWVPDLDELDDRFLSRHPVAFGRRVVALLLDMVGVVFTMAVVVLVMQAVDSDHVVWALLFVLLAWFVAIPWLTGTTPGKRVLLLKLVGADGGRPTIWRLLVRAVVLAVPLTPALVTSIPVALGVVGLLFSRSESTAFLGELANLAQDVESVGSQLESIVLLVLAMGLGWFLVAVYAFVVRAHPTSLSIHEMISGVRNEALPHRRALEDAAGLPGTAQHQPERTPAEATL
jgi:glycopeptide antibiotics resistance protein